MYVNSIRRMAVMIMTAVLATMSVLVLGANVAGAASSPKVGGTITFGGAPSYAYTILDFANPAYGLPTAPATLAIFGGLFVEPAKSGSPYIPDLAVSYSYNKANTVLTINLRHGVKFQDGTPFTADAVVWNLERDSNPATGNAGDFDTVTSMKASGKYTVIIKSSAPDGVLIDEIAMTSAGYMASPSAFNQLGETAFNVTPVGAGPYKVTGDIPNQSLTLTRWTGYWDAKHTYLQTIDFINDGLSNQTQLNDVESGAISAVQFNPQGTAASVIYQGLADRSLVSQVTPNGQALTTGIVFNPNAAPFNNILAREAIAYCTNRVALADDVDQGYATPAWIISGTSEEFTSGTVNGKLVKAPQYGESLNPYPYDPAKAEALVQQIGGLSFQFQTPSASPVMIALQQELAQCNIQMTFQIIAPTSDIPNLESGSYQTTALGEYVFPYPGVQIRFQAKDGGFNTAAGGYNLPVVFNDIAKANGTSNEALRATLWHTVWKTLNTNVEDMPLLSSGYYNFINPCLKGVASRTLGMDFTHAYLTCSI